MRSIIVGIDPGTTTAYAALSFSKELLEVKSRRNYSMGSMIKDIYALGNPILVGTDKKDVPGLIKEFSQKTGAAVFTPNYDTKKGEKKSLVQQHGLIDEVANAHETDALASAIYAYNDHIPIINKVQKYVKRKNLAELEDMLLLKIIMQEKSLRKAMHEIRKSKEDKKTPLPPRPKIIQQPKELSPQEREIQLLKKHLKKLKKKNKEHKKEILRLKKRTFDIDEETKKMLAFKERRFLHQERKNEELQMTIQQLRHQIEELVDFIGETKGRQLITKYPDLARTSAEQMERGDVVLVQDVTKATPGFDKEVIIFYRKGPNPSLRQLQWPAEDLELQETDQHAVAYNLAEVLKKAQSARKEYIKDILEEYKRERLKEIV